MLYSLPIVSLAKSLRLICNWEISVTYRLGLCRSRSHNIMALGRSCSTRKVSPNWSQETMTCHSSNCFSIVGVTETHHWWLLFRAGATSTDELVTCVDNWLICRLRAHCMISKSNVKSVPCDSVFVVSKIQLVVYYQCCVLIGWATTRLYVIAH